MYVGWKVIDAHSILSHNGNTMDLAIGSPCMLKHIYRARLQEVLTRDAFLHDLQVMRMAPQIWLHQQSFCRPKALIYTKPDSW